MSILSAKKPAVLTKSWISSWSPNNGGVHIACSKDPPTQDAKILAIILVANVTGGGGNISTYIVPGV